MLKLESVRARLVALLAVLCALVAGVAVLGLSALWRSNASIRTIYEDRVIALAQLERVSGGLAAARQEITSAALRGKAGMRDHAEAASAALADADAQWKAYLFTYLTEEEKRRAAAFRSARDELLASALEPALAAMQAGNIAPVRAIAEGPLARLDRAARERAEALISLQEQVTRKEYEDSQQRFRVALALGSLAAALGVVLAAFFGWRLIRAIADGLDHALATARKVSAGDLNVVVRSPSSDEIGLLTREMQAMAGRLHAVVTELAQREKVGSLARLASGVANGLGTPLGGARLTASTVAEYVQRLESLARGQTVDRASLAAHIAQCKRGLSLVDSSLQRASLLLGNFKQLVVDQAGEARRLFDLAQEISGILNTHQYMLEKKNVRVVEDLQPGIEVDGYPGVLGHVLNNLIANALLHAFEGAASGTITVSARSDGNGLARIEFRDDGCGIRPEALDRIYDPFYSTKMGKGGSGLGLYIVHRVVLGALGGKISATSDVGSGTSFVIVFPTTAPMAADSPLSRASPTAL